MTPPMTPPRSLADVLADTGPILLDFDGPVCNVFAGIPGRIVADQLRAVLADHGVTVAPELAHEHTDSLDILRYTANLGDRHLTETVDETMRQAEQRAIDQATPTPYAREMIVAAYHAGRPVAIVSNNADQAIHTYLHTHRLTSYIAHVTGRAYADPSLMKPNPTPVLAALTALAAKPGGCVLLGDSPSDIHAAHAAEVHTIGYANKPGKRERLTAAGADAIADGPQGMAELARLLVAEADLT